MKESEDRIKSLEKEVEMLRETLKTIENMQLSDEMADYIRKQTTAIKLARLINSTADDDTQIDLDAQQFEINKLARKKRIIDEQVKKSIDEADTFYDNNVGNPDYFSYEIETGNTEDLFNRLRPNANLDEFVGKGVRITSYNGFDNERVIVPKEINGKPVISIGEKVFMNTEIKEIILPTTIKAILDNAFYGCRNIKYIELPEGLIYIGNYCFENSGIKSIKIPTTVKMLSQGMFSNCHTLTSVDLGEVDTLGDSSFDHCSNLCKITLPETLTTIESYCFKNTAIEIIVIPTNVKKMHQTVFGHYLLGNNANITCVFLGKDTEIKDVLSTEKLNVKLIYCLPGSKIQQYAREHSIPIRPLSEFRMEEN